MGQFLSRRYRKNRSSRRATNPLVVKRKGHPSLTFKCEAQLCEICRADLASLPFQMGMDGSERDISEIKDSANSGCHACALFHGNICLLDDFTSILGTKAPVYLSMSPLIWPSFLVPMSDTPLRYILRPAKDIEHLIRDVATDSSTGSELSVNCSKQWLRVCSEGHTSCRPGPSSPSYGFTPTRLLRVSVSDNVDAVRLCEKDEIKKGTAYATLSHCWGLIMQHKLLMTNIDSLKQHISLSTLNKTFREAIHVVRRLGIDYIWIDCLCIIQDSADDWSYESELMQHIYGNSNLNIAATASSDSRGGCFRSRNPQIITPIKLDYGEAHGQFYLTDVSLWWERFEKAPLNRRAWVLQERLLSPRVLHFDSDQLVWECNELTACERFPVGIGDLVPPRLRLRARFEAVFRSAVETGLKGRDMVEIWKPIVRAYSACKLTKSSDRLIALHGVAMKIKNVLGCQYSAGLFHRDMESQLLWEIEDTKTSSRPESHIAPSWSWASILGPVSVLPQWDQCTSEDSVRQLKSEELNEMALCKVLNKTTLETQVATPSASYEVLQIRGCLCPMFFVTELEARAWGGARRRFEANRTEGSIRGFPMSEPQPDDDGDIWPLMVTRKGWSCDTGNSFTYSRFQGHPKSRVVVSSIRGNQEASFEVQLHYDVMMEHRTKEERWLMPVYGVTEFEPVDIFDMNKHRSVNGIVLEMNGKVRGSFRRCGIFKISSASGFHDQWAFWKGCQRFDVEDVKIARFDGVLIPEEDPEQGPTSNWRKNRILYRERNQ